MLLSSALLALAACDPNVVIGAKWRLAAAGTSGDTGGAPAPAGSGGVAGTGTGAVAGDLVAAAGEAGTLSGGTGGTSPAGGESGAGAGMAGEPAVPPIFFDNQPNGSLALWDEPSA
ncbi:MAG TPA: hypothetical protein VNG33_16145, partial [Polyangiaceae bacterium]|nr:hypothetical protein [Polyangiaceae bacterium]